MLTSNSPAPSDAEWGGGTVGSVSESVSVLPPVCMWDVFVYHGVLLCGSVLVLEERYVCGISVRGN